MIIELPEFLKFKKRRYLRSLNPPLKVKDRNTIRLSGSSYGIIRRTWLLIKKEKKYPDFRDYLTDLAIHGLYAYDSSEGVNRENITNRIYDLVDKNLYRSHTVKIDLAHIDIKKVRQFSVSFANMDTYDLASYLILIGQRDINGGINRLRRCNGKIYS